MAALLAVLVPAGCSKAAPAAPTLAPVAPIASCVSEDDQRAYGVTLTRTDGDHVDALIYGSGTSAVIFADEVDLDLCEWLSYAQILAKKGYLALLFNYSGSLPGEQDVLAGVSAVRQRGAKATFLVGASKGGTLVLAAAAAAQPPVDGVVSLSGPENYQGSTAIDVMGHFSTPVLFIAGDNDGEFTDAAKAMYAACAEKDKKLILKPTGAHGSALVDQPIFATIQDFFTAHTPAS
jgi:hypothetical protein